MLDAIAMPHNNCGRLLTGTMFNGIKIPSFLDRKVWIAMPASDRISVRFFLLEESIDEYRHEIHREC